MLRDDLITMCLARAGQRQASAKLTAQAQTELQLIQHDELEGLGWYPWFLLADPTDLYTNTTDNTVALPTDFLNEKEGQGLYYYNIDNVPAYFELDKNDYDFLIRKWPGSGSPQGYYIGVGNLYIFPQPDAVYNLKWRYFKRGATLSTNIENLWLTYASDLMAAKLIHRIAKYYTQNQGLALQAEKDVGLALKRVHDETVAREESDRNDVMGNTGEP